MNRGRAIWPALVLVAGACLGGGLFAGYLLRDASPGADPKPAETPEVPAPATVPPQTAAELDHLRAEVADAVAELERQRAANDALREELAVAETDVRRLSEELARRDAAPPPAPSVVEKDPTPPAPERPKIEGTIQALDYDQDIFILSVGKKHGVQVGDEFIVFRDKEFLTTIVVERVFDSHSSAHTKEGMERKRPKAGDRVTNEF